MVGPASGHPLRSDDDGDKLSPLLLASVDLEGRNGGSPGVEQDTYPGMIEIFGIDRTDNSSIPLQLPHGDQDFGADWVGSQGSRGNG